MAVAPLSSQIKHVFFVLSGVVILSGACSSSQTTPDHPQLVQDAGSERQSSVVDASDGSARDANANADGEGGAVSQDERANARESLRKRLEALSDERLAFGHQDTTAYGVGWKWDENRSDVKTLCGRHAAVQGWDLGHVGDANNLDGVAFDLIRKRIIEGHGRGAITTISWHETNPSTGTDCYDQKVGASPVLPGGPKHDFFKARLDIVAAFLDSLIASDGKHIPVVFRPFHEHNQNYFWWGNKSTTSAEYEDLWRFTADYLRVTKGQRQLLLAISPGGFVASESEYLYAYPGDDYVDVLGFDIYWTTTPSAITKSAEIASELAKARGKIAAFTEFGASGFLSSTSIPNDWYSTQVIGPLMASQKAQGIAYALTWRNSSARERFVPMPDDNHAADFRKAVCENSRILLEGEVP